ncbi:MAG: hypothetical protein WC455_11955 [Dehalococcoidia bacterium]|jgi:hypothetical protein
MNALLILCMIVAMIAGVLHDWRLLAYGLLTYGCVVTLCTTIQDALGKITDAIKEATYGKQR